FAVYHTSLLFSNQTTLESLSKHNYKIKDDGDVTTSKYLNLFDIGKRANFIQVMGPEWYFWFLPIGNS
ncbi:14073_t:CDS:2, partial [Dentiscutata heterogama]